MTKSLRVAVVGATGLVGREIVSLLAEREFPVAALSLFASARSDGEAIDFGGSAVAVQQVTRPFPEVDLAFLCATAAVSRELAPEIAASGAVVIDLAGAAFGEPTPQRRIVSPPNPLARFVAVPLQALASVTTLQRAVVTLLVSASAFGQASVDRLSRQTIALLNAQPGASGEDDEERNLAFNCIPEEPDQGESVTEQVKTSLAALLSVPLAVRVARVPTFFAHAASISLETREPLPLARARATLRAAPSLLVAGPGEPPIGTLEAVGGDAIYVGGLEQDVSDPNWLHLWAVADSVRQGAALAAVSLAEKTLGRD